MIESPISPNPPLRLSKLLWLFDTPVSKTTENGGHNIQQSSGSREFVYSVTTNAVFDKKKNKGGIRHGV